MIEVENVKYELVQNYKEAFNYEEFKEKFTDYFINFDYIVGDIAYNKLRLKGFNAKDNKKKKKINDISNLEKYIKENCSYDCKYFVLKKII